MRIIILIIGLLLIVDLAFCDEIIIPFSVYPRQLQKDFKALGYKLDLSGNDRTPDSWAFIVNRGNECRIYTYDSATKKDFKTINKVIFKRR